MKSFRKIKIQQLPLIGSNASIGGNKTAILKASNLLNISHMKNTFFTIFALQMTQTVFH